MGLGLFLTGEAAGIGIPEETEVFGGVFPQSGEPEILKIIVLKVGLSTVQTVPKFPFLSLGGGEGAVNEGIGILNRRQ